MDRPFTLSFARWPFWCLALAWLCANVPASARLDMADWLAGFSQFNHQAELSSQVRALLSVRAVAKSGTPGTSQATKSPRGKSNVPLTSGESTLKKIEMTFAPAKVAMLELREASQTFAREKRLNVETRRTPPPLPPPRAAGC